jgi:hypothetical protein
MYGKSFNEKKIASSKIFSIYLAAGLLALSACQKDSSTVERKKGLKAGAGAEVKAQPKALQNQSVEILYSMDIFGDSSNPHLSKSEYTFDSNSRKTQDFSFNPTLSQWTPSDLRKIKTHDLTKTGFAVVSYGTLSYKNDSEGNKIFLNSDNEEMFKASKAKQIDIGGKNLLEVMEITNMNSNIRNKLNLEDLDLKEHGKVYLEKLVYLKDKYSVTTEDITSGQDLCLKDQKNQNCLTEIKQLKNVIDSNATNGTAFLNPEDLSISYCNLAASPDCKELLPLKGKLEKSVLNETEVYTIQTPAEYTKKDSQLKTIFTVIKGKLYPGSLIKAGTEGSKAYMDEVALTETTQMLSKVLFNTSSAQRLDLQDSTPAKAPTPSPSPTRGN